MSSNMTVLKDTTEIGSTVQARKQSPAAFPFGRSLTRLTDTAACPTGPSLKANLNVLSLSGTPAGGLTITSDAPMYSLQAAYITSSGAVGAVSASAAGFSGGLASPPSNTAKPTWSSSDTTAEGGGVLFVATYKATTTTIGTMSCFVKVTA